MVWVWIGDLRCQWQELGVGVGWVWNGVFRIEWVGGKG